MRGDLETDLDREEHVGRVLRQPARNVIVPPFSELSTRLERRPGAELAVALFAVLVLGLVIGNALAQERRVQIGAPATAASPVPSAPQWQAGLAADIRQIEPTLFRAVVPSDVPGAVRAAAETKSACGLSISNCLAFHFFRVNGDLDLDVLEGPAGCCLDAARPGVVPNIEIRPGIKAEYEDVPAQFGGAILWWVEATDRGATYVALNSPVLTKDELIRVAGSIRPLPSVPTPTP